VVLPEVLELDPIDVSMSQHCVDVTRGKRRLDEFNVNALKREQNWVGGHAKATACHVTFGHGSSPKPQQCSLDWVFQENV
jgi:hypothetical protein